MPQELGGVGGAVCGEDRDGRVVVDAVADGHDGLGVPGEPGHDLPPGFDPHHGGACGFKDGSDVGGEGLECGGHGFSGSGVWSGDPMSPGRSQCGRAPLRKTLLVRLVFDLSVRAGAWATDLSHQKSSIPDRAATTTAWVRLVASSFSRMDRT